MTCSVGCRHGLDPTLLWLWCKSAAIAPIQPLAWELPYATGVALERQKDKKKKRICTLILSYSFLDVSLPRMRRDTYILLNL